MSSSNGDTAWIAAHYDSKDGVFPSSLHLGDRKQNGPLFNRPLVYKKSYKVFVRAYTAEHVGCFCQFCSKSYL